MFNRIHQRLGTAGFIISIVALVAALGGGAYAASGGLNGKQKKEVAKIAKTEAKKFVITSTSQIKPSVLESSGPKATASAKGKQGKQGKQGKTGKTGPQGPAGAAGPQGPAGPAGAQGKEGPQGAAGNAGAAGKSVVTAPEGSGANCTEGGSSIEVEGSGTKEYVCNGEEGAPGKTGFTATLPSEETETGTWNSTLGPETEGLVSLSFNIPLAQILDATHVHFILENGEEYFQVPSTTERPSTVCLGSPAHPTAVKGNLCVYETAANNVELAGGDVGDIVRASVPPFFAKGADVSGALMYLKSGESPYAFGTWAVTAP